MALLRGRDRLPFAIERQLCGAAAMADEGGVAAVDRALSILDALTDDKVTLAELSKRTDLYKSTVLRLLKSLEKFGYVLRTRRRLVPARLEGASSRRRSTSATSSTSEIVPPVLERIGAELHEGAVVLRLRGRQAGLPASRRGDARGARLGPRRRPPAAHRRRRRPRAARLQRRARRALRRDPPADVRRVVRRARLGDRGDRRAGLRRRATSSSAR